MFFLVIRNSSNKRRIGGAALIHFFVPDAALNRGRRLIEGGAYSSKYGNREVKHDVYGRRQTANGKDYLWFSIIFLLFSNKSHKHRKMSLTIHNK